MRTTSRKDKITEAKRVPKRASLFHEKNYRVASVDSLILTLQSTGQILLTDPSEYNENDGTYLEMRLSHHVTL